MSRKHTFDSRSGFRRIIQAAALPAMVLLAPAAFAKPPVSEVQVVNPPDAPVPVNVVGGSPAVARRHFPQVFASSSTHSTSPHGEFCSDPVPLPDGERLVVDSVVVNVRGGSEPPNVFLFGTGAKIYFPFRLGQAVGDAFPVDNVWVSNLALPFFIGNDDVDGSGGIVRVCVQTKGEERHLQATFWGTLEPDPQFP